MNLKTYEVPTLSYLKLKISAYGPEPGLYIFMWDMRHSMFGAFFESNNQIQEHLQKAGLFDDKVKATPDSEYSALIVLFDSREDAEQWAELLLAYMKWLSDVIDINTYAYQYWHRVRLQLLADWQRKVIDDV